MTRQAKIMAFQRGPSSNTSVWLRLGNESAINPRRPHTNGTMAPSGKPVAISAKPVASRLLRLFALLVFALQGYLVQTHIDRLPPAPQYNAHVSAPAAPGPADPYNPASCPLCKEILLAGVFVTPAIASLPLQLNWIVFLAATFVPEPVTVQRSLNWQSRAPPRR